MTSRSREILSSLTISELSKLADKTEYKPDVLERIAYLQAVLTMVNEDPYLSPRLVLKGGTALNLYYLNMPRLSVDLDFNYIGSLDRQIMQEERAEINQIFTEKNALLGLIQERSGNRHAGGKTIWRYPSVFGYRGTLEVDLNFMHRVHFSPVVQKSTTLGLFGFNEPVRLLDIHEVAAGKIIALQARDKSRDVFDVAMLAQLPHIERNKVRLYTVLYAAMTDKEPDTFRGLVGNPNKNEFREQLKPLLKISMISQMKEQEYIDLLVNKSNELLKAILPFSQEEMLFLTKVKEGKIQPELLTNDPALQAKIKQHPGIAWHTYGKRLYIAGLNESPKNTLNNNIYWFHEIPPLELESLKNHADPTIKKLGHYLNLLQESSNEGENDQTKELFNLLAKAIIKDPILSPLLKKSAPIFSEKLNNNLLMSKEQAHSVTK